MRTTFAVIAGLASVASAQVTALITPTASAPSGCATSYSGSFEISAVSLSSLAKRADLVITLNGGILKDQEDRTGYIASNYQFQFDGPPQTGAIYTGGWSVCSNGSLALGGSAVFYQCLSGTFYNLYSESQGGQCSQILIQTSATKASVSSAAVSVSQTTDGQIHMSTSAGAGAPITQISDGQIQGATSTPAAGAPITQISDGQVQGATSTPAAGAPITQISDGQVQGATSTPAAGAPITQISDGQVQGATSTPVAGAPITQISDGQIQGATSTPAVGAPISQISDGQVQGATYTSPVSSAVISQISDGQIQATTAATLATSTSSLAGAVISQASDGQIQATTSSNGSYTSATATPASFTGAANTIQFGTLLATVVAAATGCYLAYFS